MRPINDAALDLIKSFEGYGRQLKDGSGRCTAYQERINGKLDIPTIGWGCTKGVKMGDVWTKEQAEQALKLELAKHAERVQRLVTIELNDNEFGVLTSFDYNTGGLTNDEGKPTNTLKVINKGDRQQIAKALAQWNKFGGKVSKGLVARRSAEVALFLKPVEEVPPSFMPQQPDTPKPELNKPLMVAGGVSGGTLGMGFLADPVGMSSAAVAVKGNAGQLLAGVALSKLIVPALILAAFLAAAWFLGRKNV